MSGFPVYRVLHCKIAPPDAVLLGTTDGSIQEPRTYVLLESLPPRGQVLVIQALFAKYGVDVRVVKKVPREYLYLDVEGLSTLTDGAFTVGARPVVIPAGKSN